MSVIAQFDGPGFLDDPDEASKTDVYPYGHVPSGGTFETTAKRLKELKDLGIAVSKAPSDAPAPPTETTPEVPAAPAAADTPVDTGKENS